MKIDKNNFFIQVKYSDLLQDEKGVDEFFFGFGGELYLSPEEISDFDPKIIHKIESFSKKNNLPLRLHAPITKINYPEKIDSFIPLYSDTVKLCKALNIKDVVTHAEFNYNSELSLEAQLKSAKVLLNALCDKLSSNKINLNIENHYEIKPDDLVDLMHKIGSPCLGMCWDVGHSNAFGKVSMEEWLDRYPLGSLKEIHLADNEGDDDTHLPLGEGNIDFEKFFALLSKRKEKPVFVLEPKAFDDVEISISFLKKGGYIE